MWKRSGNLLFTKRVWIDWNIVLGIIFRGWTAADDVSKPSSHLPWHLVTRWSWSRGCRHFLSFVFSVDACFVFDFIVFCLWLWVNSDIIHCQNRHIESLQIPCLGSCPLLTDQKILLISLAKYVISGQSDTENDLLDLYWLVRIWFWINHFHFPEKYVNFIHRQSATDYKAHG